MDRIATVLVRHRKRVLALTALTTLTAIFGLTRGGINADVTQFMLEGNQRGRDLAALQAKYETGDPVMILLRRQGGFQNREGLAEVLTIRDGLKAMDGVASVGTLIPERHPLTDEPITAETLAALPDVVIEQVTGSSGDNLLMSDDGQATMVLVQAEEDEVALARRLPDYVFPKGITATFAGNPMVLATVIDSMGLFLVVIPPTAIILLLFTFVASIGSRKLAVAAIIPAVLGSIWTFGLIFGLGYRVDIVTMIVPIFVIVMGSADGLHFVSHLQEAAAETDDRVAQTVSALREVGIPMILTTISTAAGFLALVATDVGPIRQLGLFVAIGITFAGIVSFFSLPAALSGFVIPPPSKHAVGHRLTALLRWAAARRQVAALFAIVLLAFAALTAPKLRVNSDPLFFFPADHPLRGAFAEVNEVFGGATPLFGELVVDPKRPLDEQAEALKAVQAELAALPGVEKVFSVLDRVDAMANKVSLPIPGFEARLRKQLLDSAAAFKGPMGRMVTDDGLRFVLFPGDFSSEDLRTWVDWADKNEQVRVLTGMPVLYDEMARLVSRAQVQSVGMAFALIFIMLLLAYRRLVPTLTALLPLACTSAVLMGFLAASGINLHLITAVVSAIVIGVGVDYAIHLIAAIENARQDGPGYVLRGIDKAGRPILANALGVALGLSALLLSPFAPHTHISLVMWVSMTTAALTALLFIPALSVREGIAE